MFASVSRDEFRASVRSGVGVGAGSVMLAPSGHLHRQRSQPDRHRPRNDHSRKARNGNGNSEPSGPPRETQEDRQFSEKVGTEIST